MKSSINYLFAFLSIIIVFASCTEDSISTEESIGIEQNIDQPVAHEGHRNCGHNHHMDKLLSNPDYKKAHEAKVEKLRKYSANLSNTKSACASPTKLPVAIHYQGVNNPDLGCLRSLAVESIDALNKDIQGTNSDISQWNDIATVNFPGIQSGEACLEFVIASKNHPSGFGLVDGDLAVTVNQTNNDYDNRWNGYINIFVIPNTGVLGYAPLGGSGNGDGMVIDAGAFGLGSKCGNVGASAPFNLGRTLTHEMGHYLFLDHIWGGGCNQDDGVADTPEQSSDYGGCPLVGMSSCGSRDLHMNYMDYTNDGCMYMFTAGQSSVIESYVASNLGNVISKGSQVLGNSGGDTDPVCDAPNNVNVSDITTSSAKVNFGGNSTAGSYEVSYRVQNTTNWTSSTTSSTSTTLNGLTAGTNYQVKVRSVCGNQTSNYSTTANFQTTSSGDNNDDTTVPECGTPAGLNAEVISETEAKISWNPVQDVRRYQLRIRAQGTSRWTSVSTRTTERLFNTLQSGVTYEYKLRARCSFGWTSYTDTKTFTTTVDTGDDTGGEDPSCVDINFFIKFDYYASDISWELYNLDTQERVDYGGSYRDGTNNFSKDFCLPDGCYSIIVDDSYGDGICCRYGDGYFQLSESNNVFGYAEGNFGYYSFMDFCIDSSQSRIKKKESDAASLAKAKRK